MDEKKNLYDYTRQELKEKMAADFEKEYSRNNYTAENWQVLLGIIEIFNETILQTNFPLAYFNETKYNLAQVKTIQADPSRANIIMDGILDFFGKVNRAIKTAYNTIKFCFSIFGLTIASVIITIFLHLLLGLFIYAILPPSVTPLMVQSIIAAILFVSFKVVTFFDRDYKNILNNHKLEIVKFSCTVPFYCATFFIFTLLDEIPVLEEIIPIFYPHMWLSCYTGEYVYSPMIALAVNCLISIIIYLIIRRKSEY